MYRATSLIRLLLALAWLAAPVMAVEPAVLSVQELALEPARASVAPFRLERLQRGRDQATWLELKPAAIFTPDAQVVLDHGDRQERLPLPKLRHYAGRERGDPRSLAFVSVHPDGSVHGWLWRASTMEAFSRKAGEQGAAQITVVDRQAPEVASRPFHCAADRLPVAQDFTPQPGEQALAAAVLDLAASGDAATHIVRVAIETDAAYYQRFHDAEAAATYAATLIGMVSARFVAEVRTELQISHLRLWVDGTDPWNQSAARCQLFELAQHWNDRMGHVQRTTVHMLSGRALGGGIAYRAALCQPAGSFDVPASESCTFSGVSNYAGAYGVSGGIVGNAGPSDPHMAWDYNVVVHELGHNFGSQHTHCYGNFGGNLSPIDRCWTEETGPASGAYLCATGTGSLPGPQGAGSGTIMSYCHTLPGGQSNIAYSFGTGHPHGIAPDRVPQTMRAHVLERAGQYPDCLLPAAPPPHTLNVTRAGNGMVTSSPSGIDCGDTCQGTFARGTQVTLTATPAAGWRFARWGGGCTGSSGPTCRIAMPQNRNASAFFEPVATHTLNLTRHGSGTVTSTPSGINCGSNCLASFQQGTQVTLTSTPAAGWRFMRWGGGCTGSSGPTCRIAMPQNRNASAFFEPQ